MISDLFRQIEERLPPLDGWCTVERAGELAAAVVALRPLQSVVIGVWGGRDTFALAMAHKAIGHGRVWAIDPWSAKASVDGQAGANKEWWSDQAKHDLVYNRFMENLVDFGLTEFVTVFREKSDRVSPPTGIGVLVSDGNHGPQAIRDVERFAPNVVPGGIAYLDDIHWDGGAVGDSIDKLRKIGFKDLYTRDTGAFFQRSR